MNQLIIGEMYLRGYLSWGSNISKLAETLVTLPVEKISLLSYHEWGKPKYASLGRNYPLDGCTSPTQEKLESLQEIMQSKGLQVTIDF